MQDPKSSINFMTRILDERDRQNFQWGGDDHDDTHSLEDWAYFIQCQINPDKICSCDKEFKSRMIKIAALCMTAYTSIERIERIEKRK